MMRKHETDVERGKIRNVSDRTHAPPRVAHLHSRVRVHDLLVQVTDRLLQSRTHGLMSLSRNTSVTA